MTSSQLSSSSKWSFIANMISDNTCVVRPQMPSVESASPESACTGALQIATAARANAANSATNAPARVNRFITFISRIFFSCASVVVAGDLVPRSGVSWISDTEHPINAAVTIDQEQTPV